MPEGELNKINSYLDGYGYHEAVFKDEQHAYLMCDSDDLVDSVGLDLRLVRGVIRALVNNYDKTFSRRS